jgi:hypothetical protein
MIFDAIATLTPFRSEDSIDVPEQIFTLNNKQQVMNRRSFLRVSTAAAGATTLSGCLSGLFETRPALAPPLVENRPDAVYIPTHKEGMKMAGMNGMNKMKSGNTTTSSDGMENMSQAQGMQGMNDSRDMDSRNTSRGMMGMQSANAGRLQCALTYSYPHRFWTVTGDRTKKVSIEPDDSVHLMVSVWDAKTGVYVADTSPRITFLHKGSDKTTRTPWTMLSQNMGFHAGDNVTFPAAGTYSATVEVPPVTARRLRGFKGEFSESTTFEFSFQYSQDKRDEIPFKRLPERQGNKGALEPMNMKMMPLAQAPSKDDLPGQHLGQITSGNASFIVTAIEDATQFGAPGMTYLVVSPRTPYNQYIIPSMSLSGTLTRKGKTVFDGSLPAALDPKLNYHYGTMVDSIRSDDTLQLTIDAPPQVARHEGYETAFVKMPQKTLTVP